MAFYHDFFIALLSVDFCVNVDCGTFAWQKAIDFTLLVSSYSYMQNICLCQEEYVQSDYFPSMTVEVFQPLYIVQPLVETTNSLSLNEKCNNCVFENFRAYFAWNLICVTIKFL